MKNLTVLLTCLLLSTATYSQWGNNKVRGNGNVVTKERNVDSYDEIGVAGSFDVVLVEGTEGKLIIEAEENLIEHIETIVEGNQLKIKVEKGYNISPSLGKKMLVTVPFKDISKVALAGSGDVYTKSTIRSTNFKAALSGSGDLTLDLDCENIEGALAGSGDIKLSGKTNNFECKIAGSGDVHAFDLMSNNSEVSISGSGNARVNCNGGTLKVRVAGSGDVKYQGTPDKIDSKITGSGNVSKS